MNSFIHKRFADNSNSHSVASRLRRQRFQILVDILQSLPREISVLDIGGTFGYWKMMAGDSDLLARVRITLLNLAPVESPHPNVTSLVGDGRSMPQFQDGQFDIAFSNSTIEHVGGYDDQVQMAREIRRISRFYYVQTPNRFFPIEPHFVFPFFQFLPLATRAWLVQHFKLGWMPQIRDRQAASREVASIRLLTHSEMQSLFPDARIFCERFCGLIKSFVAYTIPRQDGADRRSLGQTGRRKKAISEVSLATPKSCEPTRPHSLE